MRDVLLPQLARMHRIVRWDAPGHCASTAPAQPTAETTNELLGLLDHLRIDRATLVGCSMGAGTASAFAIRYPRRVERVERLVLISTGGPPPGAPPSPGLSPPLTGPEGRRLLAATGVPVLMIVGSRDSERIRTTAGAVLRDLPSARLISIEGGSHNVVADRPREVASAVRIFVRNTNR